MVGNVAVPVAVLESRQWQSQIVGRCDSSADHSPSGELQWCVRPAGCGLSLVTPGHCLKPVQSHKQCTLSTYTAQLAECGWPSAEMAAHFAALPLPGPSSVDINKQACAAGLM